MNGPTNKRNPWELKAIGIFFITAAIIWLFQDGEDIVTHYATGGPTGRTPQGYVEVQTQALARVYGSIALVLGCICLRLYFKLRKGAAQGSKVKGFSIPRESKTMANKAANRTRLRAGSRRRSRKTI